MAVPASHCEAKLHGFRRTADGVVVSFVLHPAEVPQALALDPLGTRYMLALAQIGDDEQPVPPAGNQPQQQEPPDPPRSRREDKSPAERAVIRAALLPKDERFRAWAMQKLNPRLIGQQLDEESCADFIREECCGGNSRSLISSVPEYMDRFLTMELEFRMDVGEVARPR